MSAVTDAERELAALLVEVLQLDGRNPAVLDPEAPLFGNQTGGWGLDSIDALEIALAVQQKFGVVMRSDDEAMQGAFTSVRTLCEYVRNDAGF